MVLNVWNIIILKYFHNTAVRLYTIVMMSKRDGYFSANRLSFVMPDKPSQFPVAWLSLTRLITSKGSWGLSWSTISALFPVAWPLEMMAGLSDPRVPCFLTHWGRDKMAAVFQTTFSNAFSWMKMYEFWFHWKFVSKGLIDKSQHWFR